MVSESEELLINMSSSIQPQQQPSILLPQQSNVSAFYNDKTVFITGGTGFMGKVLLEKLLRSCPGVARIYLLIRPKKGQEAQERLQQLLSSPVKTKNKINADIHILLTIKFVLQLFDPLRKERPNDLNKVLPIEGDITQPELAISGTDRALLARTVNIVFHSAATVKFDEKLKLSITINVLGTQRLVELCKRMTNLEALVHVSTAYCNCDRTDVKELVYPAEINPEQVITLVNTLDEDLIDTLTKKLVGKRPNTYTFTKSLAECWLKNNCNDLPLVIIRPSIVLSSINGPLEGWVDNWNGPTGKINIFSINPHHLYWFSVVRNNCGSWKRTVSFNVMRSGQKSGSGASRYGDKSNVNVSVAYKYNEK